MTPSDVKKWLQSNGLNTQWLASKVNRSEGTIRNWLYNPKVQTTSPTVKLIEKAIKNYDGSIAEPTSIIKVPVSATIAKLYQIAQSIDHEALNELLLKSVHVNCAEVIKNFEIPTPN